MNRKEIGNIIGAFKTAHREKEKIRVRDALKADIMDLVRNEIREDYSPGFFDFLQSALWKLAPVTCALALLLGILLSRIDILSEYELVKLFINNPSDMSFLSLYDGS